MGDSGDNVEYVRGLVELLPERVWPRRRGGRGRRWRRRLQAPFRLKEIYYYEGGFPESRFYKEWRLCMDVSELAERCPEGSTEDKVGERLLLFFHNATSLCRVLWLSETHVLLCSDRDTRQNLFPFLPSLWECSFETEWRRYDISLHSWAAEERVNNNSSNSHGNTAQALTALHRIVALGTHIHTTRINLARGLPAYGIEDFLSRIESRRAVWFNFRVNSETARAVAFNCSRHVKLVIIMSLWQDRGAALAEAMVANQCPRSMELYALDDESIQLLAVGLRATTSIEEFAFDISMRVPENYGLLFDAIGRSGGIRSFAVNVRNIFPRYVDYMEEIFNSTRIQRLDIRGSSMAFHYWLLDSEQLPQLDAERLARLIRSNRAMIHLAYNPQDFDPETVESRVAPVLWANCVRRSMKAMLDGDASGTSPRQAASRLLASPLVRDHPESLFLVLQALFEVGALPPLSCDANFAGRRESSCIS